MKGAGTLLLGLFLGVCFAPLCAASTNFYVDPDWTGGHSGTPSQPWTYLDSTAWNAINLALASGDVTVYCSALKADGVTQQTFAHYVHVLRRDYSSNRLTIDGYTNYNSNETTPAWLSNPDSDINHAYTNGKVIKVTGDGSGALGWARADSGDFVANNGMVYCCIESHLASADNEPGVGANWRSYWDQHGTSGTAWRSGTSYKCLVKQNNVTIRGFEVTGSGARTSFNGDNFILEYLYAHDLTTIGPCVNFLYHSFPDSTSAVTISAPTTNEIVRHVRLVNTYGEAIYIGALNPDSASTFEVAQGNQRFGVEISDFYIRDAGINGGQGDGIDCKHGIIGLHVYDGEIGNSHNTGNGINLPETATNVDQGEIIERVYVHDLDATGGGGRGIIGNTDGVNTAVLYSHVGCVIRNCIVANARGTIALGFGGSTGHPITNCKLYNNTVYNCGTGTQASPLQIATLATGCEVKNNFAFANPTNPKGVIASSGVISDYNAHDGTWTSANEGVHTLSLTATQALLSVVNAAAEDFHLVFGAPIIDVAQAQASFSDDFARCARGLVWDISAYQFATTATPTPTPSPTPTATPTSTATVTPTPHRRRR